MSGFYERLIRVVKSSLQRALYNRRVKGVEFRTLLVEAVSHKFSPLIYLSDTEQDTALTPNCLVYGKNIMLASPLNSVVNYPNYRDDNEHDYYAHLCTILCRFKDL